MTIASPPPASALLTYEQYMAEEEIVARYHIVDGVRTFPDARTVEVLRLALGGFVSAAIYDDTQIVQSLVLPDLTVAVADVFRP